jgi:hypothetical protein
VISRVEPVLQLKITGMNIKKWNFHCLMADGEWQMGILSPQFSPLLPHASCFLLSFSPRLR